MAASNHNSKPHHDNHQPSRHRHRHHRQPSRHRHKSYNRQKSYRRYNSIHRSKNPNQLVDREIMLQSQNISCFSSSSDDSKSPFAANEPPAVRAFGRNNMRDKPAEDDRFGGSYLSLRRPSSPQPHRHISEPKPDPNPNPKPKPKPNPTCYVGNLNPATTDVELYSALYEYGRIQEYRIVRDPDGFSKGFGFVKFADPASAVQAADAMNGKRNHLLGRVLTVAPSRRGY